MNPAESIKDTILAEIFIVYKEAAFLFKNSDDEEVRVGALDMKCGCDHVVRLLLPISESFENQLQEVIKSFSTANN